MASTGKTEKLGLSLWEASDRPERLDFCQDNEKLEELLGGHLASPSLHLSPEEKEYLTKPYWITTYRGTGSARLAMSIKDVPEMAIVFCHSYPAVLPREDGRVDAYWDYWANVGGVLGTSGNGGIEIRPEQKQLVVTQGTDTSTQDRMVHCLNAKQVWYTVLCFGKTG